jgi:hypothetical protein
VLDANRVDVEALQAATIPDQVCEQRRHAELHVDAPRVDHDATGWVLDTDIGAEPTDLYDYPKPSVYARHEATRNQGTQRIHFGGATGSRLTIPKINLPGAEPN